MLLQYICKDLYNTHWRQFIWYLSCEGSIFPPVLCPVVSYTLLFIAQVQAELCHLLLCDLEKQSQADIEENSIFSV